MKDINISIIVPVYKVPLEYLRDCLDSLIAQTMQECEFIVVSDGAPEAECSICKEYTTKDSRFNYGIEQAQGKYITFVDSDDWIDKNTCKIIYNFAIENHSDIVLWEAAQYHSNRLLLQYYSQKDIPLLSESQIKKIISNIIFTASPTYNSATLVCCKLFKRHIIAENKIQYPTALSFSEDRIFNIQAISKSPKISYKKELLYYYRIHTKSTSHKYTPNAYQRYTAFLSLINKEILGENQDIVHLEKIRCFFVSWGTFYMHKNNKDSFFHKMRAIKELFQSELINFNISPQQFKMFPLLIQIELKLLKKHLYFPIYLHGIKSLFTNR